MRCWLGLSVCILVLLLASHEARAEFIISSAIIEFNQDTPTNQDIDIISRSKENDYIETEVSEVVHPGLPDEHREVVTDPTQSALLVTPDKTVLAGGNRKVLRFVLLRDLDENEHVYRVKIQPVIKGVSTSNTKVGLKILVGYEVLVIVRPLTIKPDFQVQHIGRKFKVINHGNTNVLFQNGKQCVAPNDCKITQGLRVYPGSEDEVVMPSDGSVSYSVWDGKDTTEKLFP